MLCINFIKGQGKVRFEVFPCKFLWHEVLFTVHNCMHFPKNLAWNWTSLPTPPPPLLPSLYKPCCKVSKFLFSRIKNFKYWSLVSLNTLFKFSWEDHGPWLLILIISLCYLYVNFKLAVTIMWSEGNISSAILPLTVSKVSCSKVIVMK